MAEVGNRVSVTSKAVTRFGVVTAVNGLLVRVRWDTGEETSLVPGPGVLSVVATSAKTDRSKLAKRPGGAKAVAKKTVKKTVKKASAGIKKVVGAKKSPKAPSSAKKSTATKRKKK